MSGTVDNRATGGALLSLTVALLLAIWCSSVLAGDAPAQDGIVKEQRPLLHTFVDVQVCGPGAGHALPAAFAEMERVNALLNNYDPASEVSAINHSAGGEPRPVSPATVQALQYAIHYGHLTGGAFDVTIGPLLRLWGFACEQPGLTGGLPGEREVQQARKLVDFRCLEIVCGHESPEKPCTARLTRPGMRIDVGAFSKGYVADCGMKVLQANGVRSALIAAGGTIVACGEKPGGQPWRIGVRHPRNDSSFLTVLTLKDTTVSTSGDYERFYTRKGKRYAHIIDPRRGRPVAAQQSVTVLAPTGVASDALSTALFVLGPQEGMQLVNTLPRVEALIVTAAGEIVFSKNWPQRTVIY